MLQFVHIFLRRDTALCDIIQTLFPACSQFRVQKLANGTVDHIKDHLPEKRRRNHLCLLVQGKIFDGKKFLQDLCPGRTRSDPASLDLRTQFLVLDELSCIFHCKEPEL